MGKIILLSILLILGIWSIIKIWGNKLKTPKKKFPKQWRDVLSKNVFFYNRLTQEQKKQFEYKVHEFILNYDIIGAKGHEETIEDKILIAAGGVVPVFSFPDWQWGNLEQILIYPSAFFGPEQNFRVSGSGVSGRAAGMVVGMQLHSKGYQQGKMILSYGAICGSFWNSKNKSNNYNKNQKNTIIHEFIHVLDMMDGDMDGIPMILINNPYRKNKTFSINQVLWREIVERKMIEINTGKSDIDSYGGTNTVEFFAVSTTYFFEDPFRMKDKHPQLYNILSTIFEIDLAVETIRTL